MMMYVLARKEMVSLQCTDLLNNGSQGSLDILVQRGGNTGAARRAVFIKNNYFHDAFFLKALGAYNTATAKKLGR